MGARTQGEGQVLVFPALVASFGGAQSVRYNSRYAHITTANGQTVTVLRSALPEFGEWSAFNLADAAQKGAR